MKTFLYSVNLHPYDTLVMLLKKTNTLFDHFGLEDESLDRLASPAAYKGLAAFHKYWGKKPIELTSFLIERLTNTNDIVLDPFLGGGLSARCARELNRRFVGIDVNRISLELADFFVNLPELNVFQKAVKEVELKTRNLIDASYQTTDGLVASHYLWDNNVLHEVWITEKRQKISRKATHFDLIKFSEYHDYSPRCLRNIKLFNNSRINSASQMGWADLFTKRALRNIELLLESFEQYPLPVRRALKLTLTSNMGQMSNMVFAISHRGKNRGIERSTNHEVGSWAIGYWRPRLHFEINVWNCFQIRANKLMKILEQFDLQKCTIEKSVKPFFCNSGCIGLFYDSCLNVLPQMPDNSVTLIITDPPHGDRIPYLELSEIWNAVLSHNPSDFGSEIVISNAKERTKSPQVFQEDMASFMRECTRILDAKKGFLAIMFNSADAETWAFLQDTKLNFVGCFPQEYSANSIAQDNRSGSMKEDYVLVYAKNKLCNINCLSQIKGWSSQFPKSSQYK